MIRWLQPYWQCLLFATAVAEALNTTTSQSFLPKTLVEVLRSTANSA